ncbi:MAG: mobile mystery protein A [Bacteroidota bacterium]|nr:mobile mystery protein A [Bacteroidota bacterium]
MNASEVRLLRQQLDAKLRGMRRAGEEPVPVRGWIRSIREALAMNGRQLAARMGVTPSRISELEEAERTGAVTINSMRRAAEALNCRFVYMLLPASSLEETLEEQVEKYLREKFQRVGQSMLLEEQELEHRDEALLFRSMRDEFMHQTPKAVWEDQ